MNLIQLRNVEKTYKNGVTAICDVNLNIESGEFIFIIGPSGCGKSTLIKMLTREEKPTNGEIYIGNINVVKLRNRKTYKLRRQIGIVFQDFKLLSKLTVYENVAFALEMHGLKTQEVREKALKSLELVGLKNKVKSYPEELSGGEQQRVAIARAIVNGPKLLLCDEPTGNLDPQTSIEIMRVLEEINKLGTTVIVVTHNKEIVNEMQKKVIEIKGNKVHKIFEKGKYNNESIKDNN